MKLMIALAAVAGGLGLAIAALAQVHEQHAAPASTASAAGVPAAARRWTPDAPLQAGIRRAQVAVEQLRHHEMGHLDTPMVVDRASEVEAAVTYMFAHCKLAAEPDAALHGILLPLLAAAQALQADPGKAEPVAAMRAALARYPLYFDDPGWDQPAPTAPVLHDEP